jgi:hypothetical protein
MGLAIDRTRFSASDHARFAERLQSSLRALEAVLARPGFGAGPSTLGAELELSLVDAQGLPLPRNRQVLAATPDPRVTPEMGRFNLELNLRPTPLAGRPFAALEAELEQALGEARRAAAQQGGRVAVVGIVPTVRGQDLGRHALTDMPRYRALSRSLRHASPEPFRVCIEGEDRLELQWDDVTLEAANTSFQVHLRVEPAAFARHFNAAQLATAPVLAASGNSPLLLGHRLWEETRVALFQQATDTREDARDPARVAFGQGWVRHGVLELFAENVALFEPLLPVVGEEDPLACVTRGGVPRLEELRLHQSTVWSWNRAVYDPEDGGHVRIELRALAAGPTVVDMLANAAFLVGLTLGLAPEVEALLPGLPFRSASESFYAAARHGLQAQLAWPARAAPSPRRVPARELVPTLLPLARRGLVEAGVEAREADALLEVIAQRVACGQTGAAWQRRTLAALEDGMPREAALRVLLERYLAHSAAGRPVHTWPVEGA